MGVASCTRTRTWEYNMVAQTTLVVFTIVLAATGVFVPEAGRELEENDALISVQNEADIQDSGHFVKRDAGRDETSGGGRGKSQRKAKQLEGRKENLKMDRKVSLKVKKELKGQERAKKRIKEGKKLDQRKRKEKEITLRNQIRDVQGKERMVSQRKQRKVKRPNLNKGNLREGRTKRNLKDVNPTKQKYKEEKGNKTVKEKPMQREGTARKTKRTEKRS